MRFARHAPAVLAAAVAVAVLPGGPVLVRAQTPTTSPAPSDVPSTSPSLNPSSQPSDAPSLEPSASPSLEPSASPSDAPSLTPSVSPSDVPSTNPTLSSAPTTDFVPGGSFIDCTTDGVAPCATKARCINDQGRTKCVCNDGYSGSGVAATGGCTNINECLDNALNDCIAGSTCVDLTPAAPGDALYTCDCPDGTVGPAGTVGDSTVRDPVSLADALTRPEGGDGKTPASGGSGCPAAASATYSTGADAAENQAACEDACVSPDAMCFSDYLAAGATNYSCACKLGFKGDGRIQPEVPGGCTRLAPVVGTQQTLGQASDKIDAATATLRNYLTEKAKYEAAQCTEFDTQADCTAATAEYKEALALKTLADEEEEQAIAYAATMQAAYEAAQAKNDVGADRNALRLEQEAEKARDDANAVKDAANTAATDANDYMLEAQADMNNVCDTSGSADGTCPDCNADSDCPTDFMCLGKAINDESVANTTYTTAKDNAEADNLIPEILTPDTADPNQDPFDEFNYADRDGDLVPDNFDACPTQMGLRRDRVAMGIKEKSSVGGVGYSAGENLGIVNPGPQDFCPSGCPETGADGVTVLDTDEDGIPDCEDRCPFVFGIPYNHAWNGDDVAFDANGDVVNYDFSSLDRNLDYHGCPDFDKDGIPDIFDQCPGCVWDSENSVCTAVAINENSKGGRCYSGCPEPPPDLNGNPTDSDGDGVPDCDDRCPGTYAPVGLEYPSAGNLTTTHGCPDLDLDGVPDYLDYCPANPGTALFSYTRKLEAGTNGPPPTGVTSDTTSYREKWLTILGCPDVDDDLVPDPVDMCDSCAYPNQKTTAPYQATACNRIEGETATPAPTVCSAANIDGVVVVDRVGCPIDSDLDGVFDGIDQCDGTIHSANDIHDTFAVVYKASDDGYPTFVASTTKAANDGVLGCPKDTDGDGVVNGIDQCPDEGGFIKEDGCPADTDRDGVSDCVSDVGGSQSAIVASRTLETWPLTIDSISSTSGPCHSTIKEPDSKPTADVGNNCCNLAYDNCDATPRFAEVSNDYVPSASTSPVTGSESGMGCSADDDKDGVDNGRDRCAYSTPIEVNYTKGIAPDGTPAVDVDDLITIDSFGCVTTLPAAWEITLVGVTTSAEADDDASNPNGPLVDADGDANPDLQVLFTTPKLLWDVQGSRGVALPPTLAEINDPTYDAAAENTYDLGTSNELIKVTVLDYSCTNKFDDSTTLTNPTARLLPTAVLKGTGIFPEDGTDTDSAGTKNIPTGSQPFYVDVELNPDKVVASPVWNIEPPFDEARIEFCLRVDLYNDMEESVNFFEAKILTLIDMTQGFRVASTEVKRNEATTQEALIDIQYDLDACQCRYENNQNKWECVDDTSLNDEFVTQDEAMSVCVRFQDPTAVPSYVRMTDLKMFQCTQGSLSHTPVLDFVRAQDGVTSVLIFDEYDANGNPQADSDDRMIVVSTNLPSAFFGLTATTVDCQGTLVYDFTEGELITGVRRRRTAEASIRAIAAPPAKSGERQLNEAQENFELEIPLAAAKAEGSSSMNAGLIAGVSVAAVAAVVAVGLLAAKGIPAVRVSKMSGGASRRLSHETDHSISDESPNHYLDNDKGYVA